MRWTVRLKRHGGAAAIARKRAAHFALLRMVPIYHRFAKRVPELTEWLEGHPLRVLNTLEQAMFDPAMAQALMGG